MNKAPIVACSEQAQNVLALVETIDLIPTGIIEPKDELVGSFACAHYVIARSTDDLGVKGIHRGKVNVVSSATAIYGDSGNGPVVHSFADARAQAIGPIVIPVVGIAGSFVVSPRNADIVVSGSAIDFHRVEPTLPGR